MLSLTLIATLVLFYFVSLYFFRRLRRKLLEIQTGMTELPLLGKARPHDKKVKGTAVICGGSIAGLVTARVCHDHFERVIIVEPEPWLATSEGWHPDRRQQNSIRARIMQYNSLQGIQVFGFMALSKLFGNLEEECKASDIRVLPSDYNQHLWGHRPCIPRSEYAAGLPKSSFASRRGFESLLRRLVIGRGQYPNITQMVGTVTGVTPDPSDTARLQQVLVRTSNGTEIIPAALVIDCTGPACGGLKWLRRTGFGVEPVNPLIEDDHLTHLNSLENLKISYDQKAHYSTLEFPLTPELAKRLPIPGGYSGDVGAIYVCITDGRVDGKSIYALRVDRDIIQVACGRWGEAELPKSLEGVKVFAKSMVVDKPIPQWFFEFLDALQEVEDTMTCSTLRVPPSSYIKYQEAKNLPSNYIAIGDSIMRVNPIFGQGVSKVIFGAISLNTLLHQVLSDKTLPLDFSTKFFKLQAPRIGPIWDGVKLMDYNFQTTTPIPGETLSQGKLIRWYNRRLIMLSFHDQQAGSALWHVQMFLAPAIDLFQFSLLFKVLWNALNRPNA